MNWMHWLAYAEPADSPDASMKLILGGGLAVVLIAGLAFLPCRLANGRRHSREGAIWLGAIVWGVVSAGLAIETIITLMDWSREQTLRLQSGYYDPAQAAADAPHFPWAATIVLLAVYLVLLAWSFLGPVHPIGPARAGDVQPS